MHGRTSEGQTVRGEREWAPAVQWLRDPLERPDRPEERLRDDRRYSGEAREKGQRRREGPERQWRSQETKEIAEETTED